MGRGIRNRTDFCHRLRGAAATLAFALWLGVVPVAAQVNTETIWDEEAEGLVGALSLDLVLKSGNNDLSLLGTTLRVQYATDPEEGRDDPEAAPDGESGTGRSLEAVKASDEQEETAATLDGPRDIYAFFGSFERGESSGRRIASSGFAYASWVRMLTPRFGWGVLAQHQFDEFTLLDQRSLLGVGVRHVRRPTPSLEMQLGTGYFYEYEELDVPPGGPDEQESYAHRWLNFLVLGATFDEDRVSFVNTLYVQPRFDAFDDYRILDEAELSVRLTARMSLGLSANLRYDSRPPAGIESTDYGLVNRLRVSF